MNGLRVNLQLRQVPDSTGLQPSQKGSPGLNIEMLDQTNNVLHMVVTIMKRLKMLRNGQMALVQKKKMPPNQFWDTA